MLKKTLLTILVIAATSSLAAGYIVFAGRGARVQERGTICGRVDVRILDSTTNSLISCDEVMETISDAVDVAGLMKDSVNLWEIENAVARRGEVHSCQAYCLADGTLTVDLTQRKAALRIITPLGNSFYSDCEGFIFPVRSHVDVPVITGEVPINVGSRYKGFVPEEGARWLKDAITLTSWVERHDYWRRMTGQIDVDSKGDFVLYPVEGGVRFILGDATQLDSKFDRMGKYYTCIAPTDTASRYSCVNLKFKNQIICR